MILTLWVFLFQLGYHKCNFRYIVYYMPQSAIYVCKPHLILTTGRSLLGYCINNKIEAQRG